MTHKISTLILSLFLASCGGSSTQNEPEMIEINLVDVYIDKGDTQCNDDGLSLIEASSSLTDAGIEFTESKCGVITGIVHPTVCGAGTSNIYYFSIDETALTQAENLGFNPLSDLDAGLGFEATECL